MKSAALLILAATLLPALALAALGARRASWSYVTLGALAALACGALAAVLALI